MAWPTLIPAPWATTPWAASIVSALFLISFALDLVFARRYAGGANTHDQGTNRMLITSLNTNLMLGLALAGLGIGRIACCPVLLGVVGCVVGTLGIVLRYGAIMTLGRLFTWRVNILDGHEVIDWGLFRYVRHPSYAGGILAVLGCFLALGNGLAMLVFCLTHVPLLLYRIRIEEQVLVRHFGPTYQAYQARTYRLFPLIY